MEKKSKKSKKDRKRIELLRNYSTKSMPYFAVMNVPLP
jgi:hypothetical protein